MEPLTRQEARMHVTVSPAFLALSRRARAGQSHVQPGATDERIEVDHVVPRGKGGPSTADRRNEGRGSDRDVTEPIWGHLTDPECDAQ